MFGSNRIRPSRATTSPDLPRPRAVDTSRLVASRTEASRGAATDAAVFEAVLEVFVWRASAPRSFDAGSTANVAKVVAPNASVNAMVILICRLCMIAFISGTDA